MPWIRRAGVAEQFHAHLRHGHVLSQEAYFYLREPKGAGLEDSPVTRLVTRRIDRDGSVRVCMTLLDCLSALPPVPGQMGRFGSTLQGLEAARGFSPGETRPVHESSRHSNAENANPITAMIVSQMDQVFSVCTTLRL